MTAVREDNQGITMYYTIVVADDEEEIRRSLIRKVDWDEAGFRVVGEAENGIEALELVKSWNLTCSLRI